MSVVEWNKKEELIVDQAIRHLREYIPLLKVYTENGSRAQMTLMQRAQEYCYENMNLMKCFTKIIMLFYKGEMGMDGISYTLLSAVIHAVVYRCVHCRQSCGSQCCLCAAQFCGA